MEFSASVLQLAAAPSSCAGSDSDLPGWDVIAHTAVTQDADQVSEHSPSPPASPASRSDPDEAHLSLPWLRDDLDALEVEQVPVRKARRTCWDLSGDPVSKPLWLWTLCAG